MNQGELHTKLSPEEFLSRLRSIEHTSFPDSVWGELRFLFSVSKTNLLIHHDQFRITRKGQWFSFTYRNSTCNLKKETDSTTIQYVSKLNAPAKFLLIILIVLFLSNAIIGLASGSKGGLTHLLVVYCILFLFLLPVWFVITFIRRQQKKEVGFMLEDLIKYLEEKSPDHF
jgi:hypothetical protein